METLIKDSNSSFNIYVLEMDDTLNKYSNLNRLDQIEKVIEEHSEIHAWVRLFLDLDDQVFNNGFEGYVSNGYHNTDIFSFNSQLSSEDDNVHQKLIELTKSIFKGKNSNNYNEFLKIISDFSISLDLDDTMEEDCDGCDGKGYEEDDEGDDYQDCDHCDGKGYIIIENNNFELIDHQTTELLKSLTKRYVSIKNDIFNEFAEYIEK